MKKTIFAGLSGGVDSSVAAARLLHQGYDVVGVFIKVWHPDFLTCDWESERLDAMRVAAHLKIPFLTCDAEAAYRDSVAEYFINGYRKGETPNPDVMCNKYVKFGAFLQFAKAHGADGIATGHYARIVADETGAKLLRGVDTDKDQSYFLWTIARENLPFIHLPIGTSKKTEVRKEAQRYGLPTAVKKDSQGICFLGHVDIPEFLSHYMTLTPGAVLNTKGERIGTHKGAAAYTIGQRHGFVIEGGGTERGPHYVFAKDIGSNTITVIDTVPTFIERTIELRETNWLVSNPGIYQTISIQTRYHQKPAHATLLSADRERGMLKVIDGTDIPAPGQSCVVYADDLCLGGGIIHSIT